MIGAATILVALLMLAPAGAARMSPTPNLDKLPTDLAVTIPHLDIALPDAVALAGADVLVTDGAGIRTQDSASGGPSASSFIHVESLCGSTCYISMGDETTLSLCPPTGETWNFHWASGVSTQGNGNVACSVAARLVGVHSNGFISFNAGSSLCSGSACYVSTNIPTSATPNGAIYGAWHDLYPNYWYPFYDDGIYAVEIGTAPNRVAIIQFHNVPWATWADGAENFEFQLFEIDNHVEVLYADQYAGTVYSSSFASMRAGEENSLGGVGYQYAGGSGVYSPPSNVGVSYRDVLAPVVSSVNVGCGTAGLHGWCRSLTNPATFTDNNDFGSTAQGLGVRSREVRVDGTSVGSYASGVSQNLNLLEGTHTISGVAIDWANNLGSASANLKIDITPPVAGLSLSCLLGNAGWCVGPVTLTPSLTDALSGVDTITCALDGAPVSCASGTGIVSQVAGTHTFTVTGTDMAGNSATLASKTWKLDMTAPLGGVSLDCLLGNALWCVGPMTITPTLTDATSGVASIACALDGAPVACTSGSGLVNSVGGAHTFTLTGADVAGNNAASVTKSFKIDTTPPVATLDVSCLLSSTGWCIGPVTITPSLTDALSGVGSMSCALDGAPIACASGVAIVSSLGGEHTFTLNGADVAGNLATTRSAAFRLDNIAPTIQIDAACDLVGAPGWCLHLQSFTVSALDAESGIAEGFPACTLDGVASACDISVGAEGSHVFAVVAKDKAGNTASHSYTFLLDGVGIHLSLAKDCATPGSTIWCLASSLDYIASAEAPVAGLAPGEPRCTIDALEAPCAGTLASQGIHTIGISAIAVSGVTKSATMTVGIDSSLPTTEGVLTGTLGLAGWYVGPVLAQLNCVDATPGSGCEHVEVSADGEDPIWATSRLMDGEGAHSVSYRSADVAGNVGPSDTMAFKIDSIAPVINVGHSGTPGIDGWFRSHVTTTVTCTDATSGVNALTFAVNGGAPAAYTGALNLVNEGVNTLSLACTDAAGNVAISDVTVKIDSIAPTAAISTPPLAIGAFDIMWSATDATAGLSMVEIQSISNFGLLGETYTTKCVLPVAGASANGACRIDSQPSYQCYRIVVLDSAGNVRVTPIIDPAQPTSAVNAASNGCTLSGLPAGSSIPGADKFGSTIGVPERRLKMA